MQINFEEAVKEESLARDSILEHELNELQLALVGGGNAGVIIA